MRCMGRSLRDDSYPILMESANSTNNQKRISNAFFFLCLNSVEIWIHSPSELKSTMCFYLIIKRLQGSAGYSIMRKGHGSMLRKTMQRDKAGILWKSFLSKLVLIE